MKALLRKDLPWLAILAIAGIAAMVAATGDGGFFLTLVVGRGHHEIVFHSAWIAGLVLGLTAVGFDEVLGMAAVLRQREIDATRLFAARSLAIGIVLLAWAIGLVGVSWLLMAVFEQATVPDGTAVAQLLASAVAALPAAAIGLFAASLPIVWFGRLVVAGAGILVVFSGIDALVGHVEAGATAPGTFLGLQALATVVFAVAAFQLRAERPDADRALAMRPLVFGIAPAVLLLVAIGSACLLELADSWTWALRRAYPEVVEPTGGGAPVLVRGVGDRMVRVDEQHVPTQEVVHGLVVDAAWPESPRGWLGFDQPRWDVSFQRVFSGRWDMLLSRGRVFVRDLAGRRGFVGAGNGPQHAPFGPRATAIGNLGANATLVHDPATQEVFRFDDDRGHFVPLPLPDGQRALGLEYHEHRDTGTVHGELSREVLVRAANATFAVRGIELVPFDGAVRSSVDEKAARQAKRPVVQGSVFAGTLDLPATAGHAAFHHEFRPRTGMEQANALLARFFAACQPPVFCLALYGIADVLVALVVALLAALLFDFQLRKFGVASGRRRFWFVATVLLGPVAMFWASWFEQRGRWAQRAACTPAAPRIRTVEATA